MSHHIHRCTACGELLGTLATYRTHRNPNGSCKRNSTMEKRGHWQGAAGVWWSTDGGWDDDPMFWGVYRRKDESLASALSGN